MISLREPYPKYLEYDYGGQPKRFKFVKYTAGFCVGYDEAKKKLAELDDWCFQYYGHIPRAAELKTLYYDVGFENLIGVIYQKLG